MLKLTLTQQTVLQDLSGLNPIDSLSTIMDDSNLIVDEQFSLYSSGKQEKLMKGESITIQPSLFVTRYVMIESLELVDIDLSQPSYVRDTVTLPAVVNTLYSQ